MIPTGRILIVVDDAKMFTVYRTMLAPEGYEIETAPDAATALSLLDRPGCDVVLLDQKLRGGRGPDTGLDLMADIRQRAPGAKIIIVTGYAEEDAAARALEAGAYDYLGKTPYLEPLLKAKVRYALEAARERRMAALANGARDHAIRELWEGVRTEREAHRKGRFLEELVALLFKSVPGFERTETNRRSLDEEIDILTPNESPDPFWQKDRSLYIYSECKNWSKPVDPKEIDRLHQKIERSFGRCRLGFFVAVGGFTAGISTTLAANRKGDILIITIGPAELDELVHSKDRNATLKKLYHGALLPRGE